MTALRVGPGFDTLGLALNRYLIVEAVPSSAAAPVITVVRNGKDCDISRISWSAFASRFPGWKRVAPPLRNVYDLDGDRAGVLPGQKDLVVGAID